MYGLIDTVQHLFIQVQRVLYVERVLIFFIYINNIRQYKTKFFELIDFAQFEIERKKN